MENASDALIMAGQILIFLVALTVCLSSFTTVRTEVNRIVGENEEIRFAKDGDAYINFMESKKGSSTRVVGSETVVATVYRAIKENYTVYIKFKNQNSINAVENNHRYINTITASRDSTVKDSSNNPIIKNGETLIKITIGSDTNQNVDEILKKENGGNLFNELKKYDFNEYLGEYKQGSDSADPSAPTVASENKQTYRIVTYVQI